MAISSSRLRSCGRGFGGRAGTHRSEHVQYELRARSLVQTCASKAERVRGSVREKVHEEAMLASSTVDERRSSSKTKVALPLSEIVWRSTPATAQIHAHLGDFGSVGYDLGLLGLRRTQIVALPTARSAKRGFSEILPVEVGGHEHSRVGIAAEAPCSAATPTNSTTPRRLRLVRKRHRGGVGSNFIVVIMNGSTETFFRLRPKPIATSTPLNPTVAASATPSLQR